MEFLLKKTSREISMGKIRIPVFVPGFRSVTRYIITEIIHETAVQWITICNYAFGVRHAIRMASLDGQL
jgi:hypothetical protein